MEYKRVIRFQYYQINCKRFNTEKNSWGNLELFDFISWLMNVEKNDLLMKSIDFNNAKARVECCKHDKKADLWAVRFMKLRDTNIPSKAKENEAAKAIPLEEDEYIGEDLTMVYDKKSGIAMIQSNRFSLNISKLEEFIEYVNGDPLVQIFIEPIGMDFEKTGFGDGNYKTLDIAFANLSTWTGRGKGKTALSELIRPIKKLGGYVGHVTVGLGHVKEDTLDKTEVRNLVAEIRSNKKYIRSAKVKVKDDDDTDVEIVDLFENIHHDFITFILQSKENLSFTYAVTEMIYKFLKKKEQLYRDVNFVEE